MKTSSSLIICFLISFIDLLAQAEIPILKQQGHIKQENLPFAFDAMVPYISANTMSLHYEKHYKGYIDNLNTLKKGTPFEYMKLKEIILQTRNKKDLEDIFNNAAQIFNHSLFWNSLNKPSQKGPEGILLKKINESFGSVEGFKKDFKLKALSQFGSGWVFVAYNTKNSKIEIIKTSNAHNILHLRHLMPLLSFDIWEHAYYLDFQNRRKDYIDSFINNIVNWDFAQEQLIIALSK